MKHLKKFEGAYDLQKLQGWVNVKVDEQLYIRMARYVTALDTLMETVKDRYNLYKKIELLSNVDKLTSDETVDIQTKISIITLLQYLNELKSQFNPSSSGFLLEGFLATLIHGVKIGDYGVSDISSSYSDLDAVQFKTESMGGRGIKKLNYQIKLYKSKGIIKINWKKKCDYYVICLKMSDGTIDVHILGIDPKDTDSYIGKYLVIPRGETEVSYLSRLDEIDDHISLNANKLYTNSHKNRINLDINSETIERLIRNCGENIKNSISKVYSSLSELHYDVDALISGYDKDKVKIPIDTAKRRADKTIKRISSEVTQLRGHF